jgi:hypothetical protein
MLGTCTKLNNHQLKIVTSCRILVYELVLRPRANIYLCYHYDRIITPGEFKHTCVPYSGSTANTGARGVLDGDK